MLGLPTRLAFVVAGGYVVSGCGQGAAAEVPADPCLGCGLPLSRMNEHFESPERMIYPAIAEFIAEPLRAHGFEGPPAESAGPGLSYAKGDALRVEFAQTLPAADRKAPAYERWLGDLRMTVYAEGELDPKVRTLFECTCSAARDVARDDLACTVEPDPSVRLAAEQCREAAEQQRSLASGTETSGAETPDTTPQERSCMQSFWLERGKVSVR